jgi:hypothetical protein
MSRAEFDSLPPSDRRAAVVAGRPIVDPVVARFLTATHAAVALLSSDAAAELRKIASLYTARDGRALLSRAAFERLSPAARAEAMRAGVKVGEQ